MRHGRHIPRVAYSGGGQFRRPDGQIQNTSGLRIQYSVRPNSYDWKFSHDAKISDRQRPTHFDVQQIYDLGSLGGLTPGEVPLFNTVPTVGGQGNPADVITLQTGKVPLGMRGTIDQISPFAQDVFGKSMAVAFPTGTTVVWKLYINGTPSYGYSNITTMLDPFGLVQTRPLVELAGGDLWQATVNVSANGAGIRFIGMRIRVSFTNMDWLNGEQVLDNVNGLNFRQSAGGERSPTLPDRRPAPALTPEQREAFVRRLH